MPERDADLDRQRIDEIRDLAMEQLSNEELEDLRFELEEIKLDVEEDMSNIKEQLDTARSVAYTERKFADPVWFRKANHALKIKQRMHQATLLLLSRSRRAMTTRERGSFERMFIRSAREILEKETYQRIVDQARRAVESGAVL